MKRTLISMLVLMALAAGGFCAAHGFVNREKDQVILTEEVLSGDRSAAEGITVNLHAALRQQAFWDSTYTVGAENPCVTDFRFSPTQEPYFLGPSYHGVDLTSDFERDMEEWDRENGEAPQGLATAYEALAKEAPVGEEVRQTIRLRDYYEFYPWEIGADVPNVYLSGYRPRSNREYQDYSSYQALQDFFRIPIQEDQITIHLTKDQDDRIRSWGSSTNDSDTLYLWTVNAVGDNACYFTLQWPEEAPNPPDFSRVPGGFGIYRLPYGPGTGKEWRLYTEDLAMVYALDTDMKVLDLRLNEAQDRLMVFQEKDGVCTMTVIDTATYETLQILELARYPDGEHRYALADLPTGFVLACTPYGLTVIEEQPDGRYAVVLEAPLNQLEDLWEFRWDLTALDWDGRRLAAACSDQYGWGCGFYLAVFEDQAMTYLGYYTSSLEKLPLGRHPDALPDVGKRAHFRKAAINSIS